MEWLWIYAAGCCCLPVLYGYIERDETSDRNRYEDWRTWATIASWPVWLPAVFLHFIGVVLRDFREECRPTRTEGEDG